MCAGIEDACLAGQQRDRNRGPGQYQQRRSKDRNRGHFYFERLDFLAQVFWRASNHQAGNEYRKDGENQHAIQTGPTPPNTTSPNWISNMGIMPPSGMKESCIALTAPQEAAVVIAANKADALMPKRVSLPSILPPGLQCARCLIDAERLQFRMGLLLRDQHDSRHHDENGCHGAQHRPALPDVANHAAKRKTQPGRNQEDRQHLRKIG